MTQKMIYQISGTWYKSNQRTKRQVHLNDSQEKWKHSWETQRLNILEWLGKDFRQMNITNPDELGVLKAMKTWKFHYSTMLFKKWKFKSENHSNQILRNYSMDTEHWIENYRGKTVD